MAVATPAAPLLPQRGQAGPDSRHHQPYVIAAIGPRAARRYFTTAETFSAESACQLGLVSELAGEDALDQTVAQWVETILANGPQAVTAAKNNW